MSNDLADRVAAALEEIAEAKRDQIAYQRVWNVFKRSESLIRDLWAEVNRRAVIREGTVRPSTWEDDEDQRAGAAGADSASQKPDKAGEDVAATGPPSKAKPMIEITDKERLSVRDRISKRTVHDEHGCWLWQDRLDKYGYGSLKLRRNYIQIEQRAHRLSWLAYRGSIPDGKWVLHQCDVTNCVNPDHLFLGDHDSNVRDAMQKGRNSRGDINGMAKLSAQDIPHNHWSQIAMISLDRIRAAA